MTADRKVGFKPPRNKRTLNQKADASRDLSPCITYSEGQGKPLQEKRELWCHSKRQMPHPCLACHLTDHTGAAPVEVHWHSPQAIAEPTDSRTDERMSEQSSPVSPGISKTQSVAKQSSGPSAIWKGLVHMFGIKQFSADAYPVSSSSCHLCQRLPHLLRSRGCIVPENVWAYLDSIWPANSKEMGVIRLQPSLSKDSSSYSMLYTYLNNKQKYGMVDSNQMEIFVVPLAAYQPLPSKLHPLRGPGLDPSHPSLLLGLILPKRTCRSALEVKARPQTKAKKIVTFNDSAKTKYVDVSSHLQGGIGQPWALGPLSEGELIRGKENQAKTAMPRQEPLTLGACLDISEGSDTQTLYREPFFLHPERPGGEAFPVILGESLQSPSGPTWPGGQLGNVPLEMVGTQPCQDGDHVQHCIDSDPSQFCNALGLLLVPGAVGPDQYGPSGAQPPDILKDPVLSRIVSAEAVPSCEASQVLPSSQILCAGSPAEESSSVVEETLLLYQHVAQLASSIPNQELQPPPPAPPPPAAAFPIMPAEVPSALSQGIAGLQFPSAQPEDSTYAHLQQLLSLLT